MMDACLNFARPPQTSPLPVNILSVHNLTKSFIVDGDQVFVLRQLDFTVNRGELICIVGPSGCGKTTLLNILAGFTPSTAGSVLLNGRPVAKPGPDRCVVFQEDALFPWLTVEENIAFGLRGADARSGKTLRGSLRWSDLPTSVTICQQRYPEG